MKELVIKLTRDNFNFRFKQYEGLVDNIIFILRILTYNISINKLRRFNYEKK